MEYTISLNKFLELGIASELNEFSFADEAKTKEYIKSIITKIDGITTDEDIDCFISDLKKHKNNIRTLKIGTTANSYILIRGVCK